MKSIVYNVYRRGNAGLSNLIMSVELGVVLASLTDRVLVLRGNKTPTANIVQYEGLVQNTYPSRITDLIELGVPWIDAEHINLAAYAPHELCDDPAWNSVCYMPSHLSTHSEDFRAFAEGRTHYFTVSEDLQHVPALSVSGGPDDNTLSYYSTFFYLDRAAQQQMHDALRRMTPKPELASFARKISEDLGEFNAVHIRRGDFKQTVGVTTLDRLGEDAIEAMDQHFNRQDRLIVLTDEADDPFFDVIRESYSGAVFLDWHILRNYGNDFNELPHHDSIALAYISQLVAARSKDFIGTMTSTFTGLIQRFRGNLGKDEPFKFLWNELPPIDAKLERGRHVFGDDIRLDAGVMVEETHRGPYTWNRVNQRLNSGWQREWPEAILDDTKMIGRAGVRDELTFRPAQDDVTAVAFLDHTVHVGSDNPSFCNALHNLFERMQVIPSDEPLATLSLNGSGHDAQLFLNGAVVGQNLERKKLIRNLYREVVRQFIFVYPQLVWLHAASAASEYGAIVLPGPWGVGKTTLALELYDRGWSFLSDDVTPLNPQARTVVPFPATPQVRGGSERRLTRNELGGLEKSAFQIDAERVANIAQPVSMIVFPRFQEERETALGPLPAARAVSTLLENSLSFPKNTDETIQQMCTMVEATPTYRLSYGDPGNAAEALIEEHKRLVELRMNAIEQPKSFV